MKAKVIFKIVLSLMFLAYTNQSFGQTETYGTIKGKVTMFETGSPYSDAEVVVSFDSGESVSCSSNKEGAFELSIPHGKHLLQLKSVFSSVTKTIEVYEGEITETNIVLSQFGSFPDWNQFEPYEKLRGLWKLLYYSKDNQTIDYASRKIKGGVTISFIDNASPGILSWTDGCNRCGNLYFRHVGEGTIEVANGIKPYCTMVGCDYIEEYKTFLRNIRGQKSKSTILNNGQTLEWSLGNEKFVFRKIHDNTYSNGFKHNTKLFGKWIPLEGKLNGKKIVTFAKGAEINIIEGKDWHKNKKQNIRNTDEMAYVGEGIDLTHKYLDEDFVSIQFRHFVRNTNEYKESSYMNEIFRKFTYGCTIKFDETKQTILLEFEGTKLFMKRA